MTVFEGTATIPIPKGKSITVSDSVGAKVTEFYISMLQKNYIFYPIIRSIFSEAKSSTLVV